MFSLVSGFGLKLAHTAGVTSFAREMHTQNAKILPEPKCDKRQQNYLNIRLMVDGCSADVVMVVLWSVVAENSVVTRSGSSVGAGSAGSVVSGCSHPHFVNR